jgi:hypothetical protein
MSVSGGHRASVVGEVRRLLLHSRTLISVETNCTFPFATKQILLRDKGESGPWATSSKRSSVRPFPFKGKVGMGMGYEVAMPPISTL